MKLLVWGLLAIFTFANTPVLAKNKVLVILSGVDFVTLKDGSKHPTGWFLPELATPAMKLRDAGYALAFANPSGKEAAMDKKSDTVSYFKNKDEHHEALAFIEWLKEDNPSGQPNTNFSSPLKLAEIKNRDLLKYSAVFFPGGHAPMQDLYRDKNVGRILAFLHEKQIITAAICHAPVVFAAAPEGTYEGYRMTIFSNEEERQVENNPKFIDGELTYYVADLLKQTVGKKGSITRAAKPWSPRAERYREVITGQNPASHHEFAEVLLEALEK